MDNTKKLKVVFDFIADYLSEEEQEVIIESTEEEREELTITEKEDPLKRAYTIMKKIDARDEAMATTSRAVNDATKPLKKQIEEVKRRYNEVQNSGESFKEKTGITLDDDGKIAEVKVGPLKEYVSIKDIIGEPNTIGDNPNITIESDQRNN